MDRSGTDPIQRCFDESYARLVRQLYGVCGDRSEAEDVVAEAFVRAVSKRRTFERLDSPEAWLRTVAVNIARSRHRRKVLGEKLMFRSHDEEVGPRDAVDDRGDRLDVVAALRRLPQEQREALALHYLADLPVAEVAEAVGAPVGTVKARLSRGRTALAAVMTADEPDVAVDAPPYDDIEKRGNRRRAVRQGATAGVAGLAVVLVIVFAQSVVRGGGDAAPPPIAPGETPLPGPGSSAPTVIPHWSDGVLDVAGAEIETPMNEIRHAPGTTIVGTADAESGSEWQLVDGDELVPIVSSERMVRLMLSPDGDVAVWVESTSDTNRRLVMWDVATRTEIDSIDVPVEVICCDKAGELFLHGIDLDHRVVYGVGTGAYLWKAGEEPVRVRGVEQAHASDPWPGGVMIQDTRPRRAGNGIFGTVTDEGAFRQVGATATDQFGSWSPDGATYVATEFDGLLGAQTGGESEIVQVPVEREVWEVAGWESDQVFITQSMGGDLARCETVDLGCVSLDPVPEDTVWPEPGNR